MTRAVVMFSAFEGHGPPLDDRRISDTAPNNAKQSANRRGCEAHVPRDASRKTGAVLPLVCPSPSSDAAVRQTPTDSSPVGSNSAASVDDAVDRLERLLIQPETVRVLPRLYKIALDVKVDSLKSRLTALAARPPTAAFRSVPVSHRFQ
jgi:hypothetical protein